MLDFDNTIKTTAGNIWPGMILKGHEHRGRVVNVLGRGNTPWGTEKVEINFGDGFEGFCTETIEPVEFIKE
jgi:hypothetical protein|tara:strand:+ start:392 stop:604 length:213 start_codon:yes stop_codon:yes gene_type:complete